MNSHRGESRGVRRLAEVAPRRFSQGFCELLSSRFSRLREAGDLTFGLLEDKAMTLKLIAWALVSGTALFSGLWGGAGPTRNAEPATAAVRSCHVKVHLPLPYDLQNPYRIAHSDVGHDCSISKSVRTLSPSEFAAIAGPGQAEPEQEMLSLSNRVKTRARAEHAQIMMAQVDAYETWIWNGSAVTGYNNGWVQSDTGGCGWYVTDGPYAWWETGNMPYAIWIYGWTNFSSSCNPVDRGWMQPAAWGDYDGNWSGECDMEMYLPYGSALQCIPTLVY